MDVAQKAWLVLQPQFGRSDFSQGGEIKKEAQEVTEATLKHRTFSS